MAAEKPKPDPDRFKKLPEHVELEDTVAEHPASDPPDPDGNIDPEKAFFLRNAGG